MAGGGGGSGSTRIEPPKHQLPFLTRGLDRAEALFSRGPTVVPFAPQTEQALSLIQNRALGGSPVTRAGQDFVTGTLRGDFLNSNPHLNAAFQRAADASQGRLASEFAGSGRREDDAGGTRSFLRGQQLNDLATSFFGNAFENERNRQLSVLPFTQSLADADFRDLAALRGVGGEVEGLAQRFVDAPGNELDRFIGRVSGNQGQTQIQRTPSNPIGGALGGAMLGSIFGPFGTLGGGILGGIFG